MLLILFYYLIYELNEFDTELEMSNSCSKLLLFEVKLC